MVPARWGRQIESSAPARPTPSLSWMASWSEDIPLSLLTPMFVRLILGRRSPEVLLSPNHKEKSFSPSSLTKFPSLVSTLIRSVTIPSRCRQRRQASRVSQCYVEMSQSSPLWRCGPLTEWSCRPMMQFLGNARLKVCLIWYSIHTFKPGMAWLMIASA